MVMAHLPPLPARDPLPVELAPRIDDLKLIVGAIAGLPPQVLAASSRARRHAHPRQICMTLARDLTPLSTTRIGKAFNRDHTTVLHAARNVLRMRAIDPLFAARESAARAAVHDLLKNGNGLRPPPGTLNAQLRMAAAIGRLCRAFGMARDAAQDKRHSPSGPGEPAGSIAKRRAYPGQRGPDGRFLPMSTDSARALPRAVLSVEPL